MKIFLSFLAFLLAILVGSKTVRDLDTHRNVTLGFLITNKTRILNTPVRKEHRLSLKVPKIGAQQLIELSELVFDDIKSYVKGTYFRYHRFSLYVPSLEKEQSEIRYLAEYFKTDNFVTSQFHFCTKFLLDMMHCANYLIKYNDGASPFQTLFRRIIFLKVKAMVMYNSRGAIDLHINSISEKVTRLRNSLHSRETEYKSILSNYDHVYNLCGAELEEAKMIIEDLYSQISKRRKKAWN